MCESEISETEMKCSKQQTVKHSKAGIGKIVRNQAKSGKYKCFQGF